MSSRATAGIDVERALGGAVAELAHALRGEAPPAERGGSLAGTLASHGLTASVRGCAVCVIDGEQAVVAGVAGSTGQVTAGSVWEFASSPISEALARAERILPLDASASGLGQALGVAQSGQLVAAPLRIDERGDGEPTSLGALLLIRDRPAPLGDDEAAFLEDYASLVALALRHPRPHPGAPSGSEDVLSFLNLVVHDLRAPLTVLSGYVDLLRAGTFGEGPQAWKKPMEMIAGKLQETQRLVDDILLAARLESGAVPASFETLDLNEAISRAAARGEARAGLAGALIEAVPHPHRVEVSADVFQVDRIVDNLINNAISYGGPSPWIRLSVDATEPPAIRVEDGGVGISPEFHSRIFERFFRVENLVPGTGFGLHVGRMLAEACGGSLCVERSALGEGSVFRLELPAAVAEV